MNVVTINLLRMAAFLEGYAYGKTETTNIVVKANECIKKQMFVIEALKADLDASQAWSGRAEGCDAGIQRDDLDASRWGLL